jgi:hypothetical protein
MISNKRAREIASNWHNGQWSHLYQFTSSGVYLPQSAYIQELNKCIPTCPQDATELKQLIKYFKFKDNEVITKKQNDINRS